jgi:predicted neuraminidase
MMRTPCVWWFCVAAAVACAAEPPRFSTGLIFPPETWHVHASCVIELKNGDLLACWFHGSGERTADDVKVEGARLPKGASTWGPRFELADTPGFPDCNPTMFIDAKGRLWLMWAAILSNQWESALLKYRVSSDYLASGAPKWENSDVVLLKPPAGFEAATLAYYDRAEREALRLPAEEATPAKIAEQFASARALATDRLHQRIGWMPRAHPLVMGTGRIVLPLYSDGFDFSIMALSDDDGATWRATMPLFGAGNIQPSIVQRRDGRLYTLMRDNGPAPHRLHQSESVDAGETWGPVTDTDLPNPASGAEIIALRNGHWLLVSNDTDDGRWRLTAQISDDEGKTWKWRRALADDPPGNLAGRYHYPSAIQTSDGMINVTYSDHQKNPRGGAGAKDLKSIRFARFNEAWVMTPP